MGEERFKTTAKSFEKAVSSRSNVVSAFQETLDRIEREQGRYTNRLDSIEDKLNSQLTIVAENTTAMSRSLEAIQQTNSRLVEAITGKNTVPASVLLAAIIFISVIFLMRELALTGGRARISMNGLDLTAGGVAEK